VSPACGERLLGFNWSCGVKTKQRKNSDRAQGLSSRPPLERMLAIHQALQRGAYPNANLLAGELEVCSKSIHRDLTFMRDRLRLPIEWHFTNKGFYYTQAVNAFPTMHLTQGELVALVVAEKALKQYRGTPFEKPLLSAVEKMRDALPETMSVDLADLQRTISFRTRAEPILDLGTFDVLARATAAHRQLEITYRKPGQTQGEKRTVDPYHLANINGEWFLFAYDHLRKDIRTFVPARMISISETGRSFVRRQKFSLEQRLRGSFGVHSGGGDYEVVLRFTPEAADYIREKKWHDSQQLRNLKNGGVELTMKLSSLEEVQRWVLSWGGNATVLAPAELQASVKAAARRMLGTGR
jgi:proteasome accessory factor B